MTASSQFRPITRAPEVCRAFGLARSTLYSLIARGEFPSPVKLGSGRLSGWLAADLEAYLASRRVAPTRGKQP